MNMYDINQVEKEMKRLSGRIRYLKIALDASNQSEGYFFMGNKYTAAVRRTSMDLTRALADLRRND
jgi:hypothetical protein